MFASTSSVRSLMSLRSAPAGGPGLRTWDVARLRARGVEEGAAGAADLVDHLRCGEVHDPAVVVLAAAGELDQAAQPRRMPSTR